MKHVTWVSLVGLMGCAGVPGCGRNAGAHSPSKDARATLEAPATVAAPPLDNGARKELEALLSELRRGGKTQVRYREPTQAEREAFAALIGMALADEAHDVQRGPFVLRTLSDAALSVVGEKLDARAGAGAVALRRGAGRPVLIEAPHTFFDMGTLDIALGLFFELQARALIVNTVHRGSAAHGDEDAPSAASGELASDVAHQPGSLFSVAHARLLAAYHGALSIQVHGFADASVPGVDAVVSAAGSKVDAKRVARSVGAALPGFRVAAYPDDVRRLGGLQNAQAHISRDLDAPFIHLELAKRLRTELTRRPDLLKQLGRALGELTP